MRLKGLKLKPNLLTLKIFTFSALKIREISIVEILNLKKFSRLRRYFEKSVIFPNSAEGAKNFFGLKISTMLISRIFKAEKVKILNINKFGFDFRPFILTFYLSSTINDDKTAQIHQKQRKKHRELMKNSVKFAQK